MSSKLIYYVYAYLRSKDSNTAKAGTPYYIGKGKGNRVYGKHRVPIPTDPSCIILLETNLSDLGALALERRLIRWWGRTDLVTGILRNMTDGGEGVSGRITTIETKQKIGKATAGKSHPRSESTRKKISAGNIGKHSDYVATEETRQKIREKRKLQSPTFTGKTHTAETKEKIREKRVLQENYTRTAEINKRSSDAQKGKVLSDEHLNNLRIAAAKNAIPLMTPAGRFDSRKDAAAYYGVSTKVIGDRIGRSSEYYNLPKSEPVSMCYYIL